MRIAPLSGAVDWNCNASIDAGTVVANVNPDDGPALSVLKGGKDQWSRMYFNFRNVANFGAAGDLSIPPPDDLPTPEEVLDGIPKPRISLSVDKDFPPRGRPFAASIRVVNDGQGPAKGVTLRVELRGQVATFDLGTLLPGTSVIRHVAFSVPPACNYRSNMDLRVTLADAVDLPLAPVQVSALAAYCGK